MSVSTEIDRIKSKLGIIRNKFVSLGLAKSTDNIDALATAANGITEATQATPSITVSSGGLITASATQTAGYVSAGTRSATKQLPQYDGTEMGAGVYENDDDYAYIQSTVDPHNIGSIIEDVVYSKISLSDFGNAKASDVKKGVSFTSADGVKLTGTYDPASINTCTVTINIVDNVGYLGVTATQFANGAVTTFTQSKSSGSFSIPNVVCGSVITVVCNGYFSISGWSHGTEAVGSSSHYLKAPTTTGNYSANIIAYDD